MRNTANTVTNDHEPTQLGRRKAWALTVALFFLLSLQLETDLSWMLPINMEDWTSSALKGSNSSTLRGAASSTRYVTDNNNATSSSSHSSMSQSLQPSDQPNSSDDDASVHEEKTRDSVSNTTDSSASPVIEKPPIQTSTSAAIVEKSDLTTASSDNTQDNDGVDFNTTLLPRWKSHHISLEDAKPHQIFPPPSSSSTTNTAVDGTIIVNMSGELGNAMNHIIYGRVLQLWAYQSYNMTTRLVLKPQILGGHKINTGKTRSNEHNIHQCWTHMKAWKFFEGVTPKVKQREEAQSSPRWKDIVDEKRLALVNKHDETEMWQGMDHFHELSHQLAWKRSVILGDNEASSKDNDTIANDPYPPPLLAQTNLAIGKVVGRYYHQIRTLLEFDTRESGCCALLPDPDETVFHFRNFETELLRARRLGFEDLTAYQIAHEVFGLLKRGDKIAITTRMITGRNNAAVDNVVGALKDRGLQVRIIGQQTPVQDFCFLMHAKKELVGSLRSTYFILAGILGNASGVRGYAVDSQRTREISLLDRLLKVDLDWGVDAEAELTSRFHLEVYEKDENITDV